MELYIQINVLTNNILMKNTKKVVYVDFLLEILSAKAHARIDMVSGKCYSMRQLITFVFIAVIFKLNNVFLCKTIAHLTTLSLCVSSVYVCIFKNADILRICRRHGYDVKSDVPNIYQRSHLSRVKYIRVFTLIGIQSADAS